MDEALVQYWQRAFDLAFFIHRDRAVAREILVDALGRVEVLAATQAKRRYYRPKGRSRARMARAQLLQRLIYSSSEPYERRQEEAHLDGTSREPLGEDDLTVRYVTFLGRICLRRNAFHVAVGLGRLLHTYPTAEVLALDDLVSQRADRLRDADYVRARKKRLMHELKERFHPFLRLCRGSRGEQRFESRTADDPTLRLVERCLENITPWQTDCCLPEPLLGTDQTIDALRSDGIDIDDQARLEMNRIHALLHPRCLARLTRALGLAAPSERLDLPRLRPSGDHGDGRRHGDRNDRRDDPRELDDDEIGAIRAELDRREDLRQRVLAGVFRVRLDGREALTWDADRNPELSLAIDESTELVEIVAGIDGEDALLAAHFLPPSGTLDALRSPAAGLHRARTRLVGGPLRGSAFVFELERPRPSPGTSSDGDSAICRVVFRPGLKARMARMVTGPKFGRKSFGRRALPAVLGALLVALFLLSPRVEHWLPGSDSHPPRSRSANGVLGIEGVRFLFLDPSAKRLEPYLPDRLAAADPLEAKVVVSDRRLADAILRLDAPVPPERATVVRLVDRQGKELARWPIPDAIEATDSAEGAAALASWLALELGRPLAR